MSDLTDRAHAMLGTLAHAKAARVSPAYPDSTYERMIADLLAEVERLTAERDAEIAHLRRERQAFREGVVKAARAAREALDGDR